MAHRRFAENQNLVGSALDIRRRIDLSLIKFVTLSTFGKGSKGAGSHGGLPDDKPYGLDLLLKNNMIWVFAFATEHEQLAWAQQFLKAKEKFGHLELLYKWDVFISHKQAGGGDQVLITNLFTKLVIDSY